MLVLIILSSFTVLVLLVDHYYMQKMDEEIQQRIDAIHQNLATIATKARDEEDRNRKFREETSETIRLIGGQIDNLASNCRDAWSDIDRKGGLIGDSLVTFEKALSNVEAPLKHIIKATNTLYSQADTNKSSISEHLNELLSQSTDIAKAHIFALGQRYALIRLLKSQGQSTSSIAKHLGISSDEVAKIISEGQAMFTVNYTTNTPSND